METKQQFFWMPREEGCCWDWDESKQRRGTVTAIRHCLSLSIICMAAMDLKAVRTKLINARMGPWLLPPCPWFCSSGNWGYDLLQLLQVTKARARRVVQCGKTLLWTPSSCVRVPRVKSWCCSWYWLPGNFDFWFWLPWYLGKQQVSAQAVRSMPHAQDNIVELEWVLCPAPTLPTPGI